MEYAENNRISHRQLYRQIILAFLAPFLLCLYGRREFLGINGIVGTGAALVLLMFYVIFLIRLEHCHTELLKTAGGFWARVIGLFFLSYVLLSGAYLLAVLKEIIPVSLLPGMPGWVLALCAILVCSMGTHRGMQRRGRMAEVSGALLLWGIVLMMVLCLGQGKVSYLRELRLGGSLEAGGFLKSTYGMLCAFSGLGLLPFALGHVEKPGSAGRPAAFGVLTLGAIVVGLQLLLPAVFGWDRLLQEPYPVLPLLAGADLPGNVLARFDVLWLGFLLYSLLFAVGSLLHYGHQVIRRAGLGSGRWWMAAAIFLLCLWEPGDRGIMDYYGMFLEYIFVPGLVLIQLCLMLGGRKRRKKKGAVSAAVLCLCLFLGGCAGIEPEKRMYPLALGADIYGEGFALFYGMPDLPQATGQEKPEEDSAEVLTVNGADLGQIEAAYNRSQEKYLDLGHLQVLILGEKLLENGRWQTFLEYLKEEPFVGENVYVFCTDDVEAAVKWKGSQGSSVGEYLQGLLENRIPGQQKKGVTLRQLYYEYYKNRSLPELPRILVNQEELQVFLE